MPSRLPFKTALLLALPLFHGGAAVITLSRPLAVEGKGNDRQTLGWINTRHWTRPMLEELRDTLKAEGREPDLAEVEAALVARDHWEEGRPLPFARSKQGASGEPLLGWDAEGRELRREDLVPGADLADACFLPGAALDGLDLRGVRFDGADLEGADLRGSVLVRASFAQAHLLGARFSEAIPLHDSRFLGALLQPPPPAAEAPPSILPATPRTPTGETLAQNGLEVRIRSFDPESLMGRPGGPGVLGEWVLDGLMAGAPRRIVPHSGGLAAVMEDGRTLLWLSRQGCEELVFPESEGPIGPVVPEQGKLKLILGKGGRLVQVKRGEDSRLKLAGVARLTPAAVAVAMGPPTGDMGPRTALREATQLTQAPVRQADRFWCLSSLPSATGVLGLTERNVILMLGKEERSYHHAFTWRSNPPLLLRDTFGQTLMLLEGRLQMLQFRNGTGGKQGRSRRCLAGPLADPLPEKARVTAMCLGPDGRVWFAGTGFEGLGRVDGKGRVSYHKVLGGGGGVPRAVVSDGVNLYLALADRASILVYQPFKAAFDEAQALTDERLAVLKADLAAAKEEQRRLIADVRAERRNRDALIQRVEAELEARMAEWGHALEDRPKPRTDVGGPPGEAGSELDDMRKSVETLEATLAVLKGWDEHPSAPQPVAAAAAPEEEPWEVVKGRPRFRWKTLDWTHIEAFHGAGSPRFKSRFDAGLTRQDIGKLIEETLAEPQVWRRSGDCWVVGRNFGRLIGRDQYWGGAEEEDSGWQRADALVLVLDGEGRVRTAYPALSLPASGPSSTQGETKEAAPATAKGKRG